MSQRSHSKFVERINSTLKGPFRAVDGRHIQGGNLVTMGNHLGMRRSVASLRLLK